MATGPTNIPKDSQFSPMRSGVAIMASKSYTSVGGEGDEGHGCGCGRAEGKNSWQGTCDYKSARRRRMERWSSRIFVSTLVVAIIWASLHYYPQPPLGLARMMLPSTILSLFAGSLLHQTAHAVQTVFSPPVYDDGNSVLLDGLDPNIFQRLGQYTPRYTVGGVKYSTPKGCHVQVVNSLERHGARFETKNGVKPVHETLKKFQDAIKNSPGPVELPPELAFLAGTDILGGSSSIIPFGALQAYYSGRTTASLYPHLADISPFVRASGDEEIDDDRIILTANFWKLGFLGKEFPRGVLATPDDVRSLAALLPQPDVTISEFPMMNNTLKMANCPRVASPALRTVAEKVQLEFVKNNLVDTVGKELEERFRKAGVQDLKITASDLMSFARTCSFDTLSRIQVHDGKLRNAHESPFCGVFQAATWPSVEYMFDIGKYYSVGYAAPYHKAMGTGFLRELVSRFTGKTPSLQEPTSINSTIDGDASQFPLPHPDKGPFIYFDGTHDDEIASILTSIGLFNGPRLETGLGADKRPRTWYLGQMVPLQGKIVFEKLQCSGRHSSLDHAHQHHVHGGHYVRILANGKVLDADKWCHNGDAGDGLCDMRQFVDQLSFAQHADEWNKCYE